MSTATARAYDRRAARHPSLGASKRRKAQEQRVFRGDGAWRACIKDSVLLDPACGSGNFLTETYLSLRKLENRVLEDLYGEQMVMGEVDPIQVTLDQFYGIEINDFAVEVAKTALWIAELQMLDQTREILSMWIDPLPLKTNDNIVCANALRTDWNDVISAEECDYIIGNPPFISQDGKDDDQKADMELVWGDSNDGYLDYVTAWYKKAADYYGNKENGAFAFVSTNSICQGQPVAAMFKPLFENGWRISFAWPTFVWKSEALDKANVHVVIVGMDRKSGNALLCSDDAMREVDNINPYLAAAPTFFIDKMMNPLCSALKPAVYGSKPADGGFLQIKTDAEHERGMSDPIAARYIRRCLGATELINGKARWCLWLEDARTEEIVESPFLNEHVSGCREWRSSQKPTGDAYKLKDAPQLFRPNDKRPRGKYLCLPCHFSGGREYFTADFVEDGAIATNACFMMDDPDGLAFAVLSSSTFMLWQNTVGGRLKSDCRFANTLVWNTFPLPDLEDSQREAIVEAGRGVLDARRSYEGKSLADLYKPDDFAFYDRLVSAHKRLDVAVYRAFGLEDEPEEGEVSTRLIELYAEMTAR